MIDVKLKFQPSFDEKLNALIAEEDRVTVEETTLEFH